MQQSLAGWVMSLMRATRIGADRSPRQDHGAWSALCRMRPQPDALAAQVGQDAGTPPGIHANTTGFFARHCFSNFANHP